MSDALSALQVHLEALPPASCFSWRRQSLRLCSTGLQSRQLLYAECGAENTFSSLLSQGGALMGWGLNPGAFLMLSTGLLSMVLISSNYSLFFLACDLAGIWSFLVVLFSFPIWIFLNFFLPLCFSLSLMTYIRITCNDNITDSMFHCLEISSTKESIPFLFIPTSRKFPGCR